MEAVRLWLAKVDTNEPVEVLAAVIAGADTVLSMPGNASGSVSKVEVYGLENGGEGKSSLSNFPDRRKS